MTKHLFLTILFAFLFTLSLTAQNVEEEYIGHDVHQTFEKLLISRMMNVAFEKDPSGICMWCLTQDFIPGINKDFGMTTAQIEHWENLWDAVAEIAFGGELVAEVDAGCRFVEARRSVARRVGACG
jgi:hypothetical protein